MTPHPPPSAVSLRVLHPAWTRAALLGSVWAAIEIVLGSFLHNAGVPMAGTLLAAIGVTLLVAGSEMWNTVGVIWRAGVICALMKSVSPSAVILGPMIGIVLEAVALETSTRILGRNPVGYIVGGALAVSMPILQKIAGVIVLYGLDAARLYIALYEFAARSLRWTSLGPLEWVLLLFLCTIALGITAATLGLRTGRRAAALPVERITREPARITASPLTEKPPGPHSLPLLFVHPLLMSAGLAAVSFQPLWLSAVAVGFYLAFAFIRYPLARRKFSRLRVWIEFGAVSILAGLLLGELTSRSPGWNWGGLVTGAQMALRASLVISAFSCISTELRNPVVIRWFLRRGLGQISAALDIAFEALPAATDSLGKGRHFFHQPTDTIVRMLARARDWLASREMNAQQAVVLLTGEQGSGKTRTAIALAAHLRRTGISVGGVVSVCIMDGETRVGYDVLDLDTGARKALCRTAVSGQIPSVGQFFFLREGVDAGLQTLRRGIDQDHLALMILDEVGPLELEGRGWAPALPEILSSPVPVLLLTVRPKLIDRVCHHWNLRPAAIWESNRLNLAETSRTILHMTENLNPVLQDLPS